MSVKREASLNGHGKSLQTSVIYRLNGWRKEQWSDPVQVLGREYVTKTSCSLASLQLLGGLYLSDSLKVDTTMTP